VTGDGVTGDGETGDGVMGDWETEWSQSQYHLAVAGGSAWDNDASAQRRLSMIDPPATARCTDSMTQRTKYQELSTIQSTEDQNVHQLGWRDAGHYNCV